MRIYLCSLILLTTINLLADEDAPGIEPNKRYEEKQFQLKLGYFYPAVSTKIRLDSAGGELGTLLDMESDLGLENRQGLFQGEFDMAVSENWRWGIDYFQLNRFNKKVLNRGVTWGGKSIPTNIEIDAFLHYTIWRTYAAYEWRQSEKVSWGWLIGLHDFDVEAGIGITQTNPSLPTDFIIAQAQKVPLPNAGVHWDYKVRPRWVLNARLDIFALEIDDYKGSLVNFEAGARYFINDYVATGLSFAFFDLHVSMKKPQWTGRYNFNYRGPKVFVNFNW